MTTRIATAFFSIEMQGGAPEWVELFPAGPTLAARDGRRWRLADPQVIVAAFEANQGPLAIDYEHAQYHKAPNGDEAPAAGWITALEVRDGQVWGKVDWTERAAGMIASREYRFLSPEFAFTKSGDITALVGAGLVNRPAFVMTALSRKEETSPMPLKAIAKALGLDEASDETAILAEISKRAGTITAICQALAIDVSSDEKAIAAAIKTLKNDKATAIAAAQGKVPESALTDVTRKLEEATAEIAALKKTNSDREIDAALDKAVAAGKITPASRDEYRAMCAAEGGLDRFKKLVEKLPVIGDPTDLDKKPATARTADDELDPVALAAEARKLQDEAATGGRHLSMADAVALAKEKGAGATA